MNSRSFAQQFIIQPVVNKANEFFVDLDHFIFVEFISFKKELLGQSTFNVMIIFLVFRYWFNFFLAIFILIVLRWIYLLWKLRKPLKRGLPKCEENY